MDTGELEGRVGLVTRGSGGIGRAIAVGLALAGGDVAITYASRPERAEETAAMIRDCGRRAVVIGADLTDPQSGDGAIEEATASLRPITVLVANAALGHAVAGIDEVDDELWSATFDFNIHAPFVQCQHLLPNMADAGVGRVLFTSSVAATSGGLIGPHYAASKAASTDSSHGSRPDTPAPVSR